MNRTVEHLSFLVVVAAGLLGAPGASEAAVQCKAQPSVGLGPGQGPATSSWTTNVTNQYGAAWANLNLARNVSWSSTGVIIPLVTVTAIPCRPTLVVRVPGNLGAGKKQLPQP